MKLPDADIRDIMVAETFAGKSEVAFGHVSLRCLWMRAEITSGHEETGAQDRSRVGIHTWK